jgi:hypothetical protein
MDNCAVRFFSLSGKEAGSFPHVSRPQHLQTNTPNAIASSDFFPKSQSMNIAASLPARIVSLTMPGRTVADGDEPRRAEAQP